MILDHVSIGTVEAARIGCLINAGSAFTWKDGSSELVRVENVPWGAWHTQSTVYFGIHKSWVDYIPKEAYKPLR